MGKKRIERKYDLLMESLIPEEVTLFNQRTVRMSEYNSDEDVKEEVKDDRIYVYDALKYNEYAGVWINTISSLFEQHMISLGLSPITSPLKIEQVLIYYDPDRYSAKRLIQAIIRENYRRPNSIIFSNEFRLISDIIEDTGIYNRDHLNVRSILMNSDLPMYLTFEPFKMVVTLHVLDTMCWLLANTALRHIQKNNPNYPVNEIILTRMMRDKQSLAYLDEIIEQLMERKGRKGFPIDLCFSVLNFNRKMGHHRDDLVFYKKGSIETGTIITAVREINDDGTNEYNYKFELQNHQKYIMDNTLKSSIIEYAKMMAFLTHYSNYIDNVIQTTIKSLNE